MENRSRYDLGVVKMIHSHRRGWLRLTESEDTIVVIKFENGLCFRRTSTII